MPQFQVQGSLNPASLELRPNRKSIERHVTNPSGQTKRPTPQTTMSTDTTTSATKSCIPEPETVPNGSSRFQRESIAPKMSQAPENGTTQTKDPPKGCTSLPDTVTEKSSLAPGRGSPSTLDRQSTPQHCHTTKRKIDRSNAGHSTHNPQHFHQGQHTNCHCFRVFSVSSRCCPSSVVRAEDRKQELVTCLLTNIPRGIALTSSARGT